MGSPIPTRPSPTERLGAIMRRLGEGVEGGGHLVTPGEEDELVFDLARHSPVEAPIVIMTIKSGESRYPTPVSPELAAIASELGGLSGQYEQWLRITIRFRRGSLPLPVGFSIAPALQE